MRVLFLVIVLFHGLIHLLGFAKAFNLAPVSQLTQYVSKSNGVLWFLSAILFITFVFIIYSDKDFWWIIAFCAVVVSQYLIFTSWHDAKFGTIANVIVFLATIIGFGEWNFSKQYRNEVNDGLRQTAVISDEILRETDIERLPDPIKKYLRYTGSVGKPKVKNFRVEFSGKFRQTEKSGWMHFTSEQYNFMEEPTRLFFMKATMKHLPIAGFHSFINGKASMDIRLLSLFKVQYQSGEKMNVSETVTFFNDMCVMAPPTLIDSRIRWVSVIGDTVKAEFTNKGITIAASLFFNDKGELINFVSDDRFAVTEKDDMVNAPWSTPLKEYKEINGYKLANYGETTYSFPEGDFCYGKFRLKDVYYNLTKIN